MNLFLSNPTDMKGTLYDKRKVCTRLPAEKQNIFTGAKYLDIKLYLYHDLDFCAENELLTIFMPNGPVNDIVPPSELLLKLLYYKRG